MRETEFVFLYSTFPDAESAKRVGEALVAARVAACVNIHPSMTSVYEWQGKMEIATECAAFIKLPRANVESAIALARPLHPYIVPCFLTLAIEGGNEDYLEWARTQTRMAR